MNLERAEELFSKRGFWLRVFPNILVSAIVSLGIGLVAIRMDVNSPKFTIVILIVVALVVVPQVLRYFWAAQRHEELKLKHGQLYVRLIEDGKVPISAVGILMLGAPGRQAKQYFPEDQP